jgi:hypothetical protein
MICNNCSTLTILQRLREEYPNYTLQYVLDFERASIRFFARRADRTWYEITVGDAERNYFNTLLELYRKNGGSLVVTDYQSLSGTQFSALSVKPADASAPKLAAATDSDFDSISAWDVANSGNPRERVAEAINGTRDAMWARIAGNTQMAVGSLRMLFGADNSADIRVGVRELAANVVVTFKDGSKAKFSWNPYTKAFEYVPKSSRDSDGNIIPDTADEVTGGTNAIRQYNFSGTAYGINNAIRFYQRVTVWNVQTPPPSTPAVLVCTQVDSGPRVCRLQQ